VGATIALAFMAADSPARSGVAGLESPGHPGAETYMAQGPSPCGCSTDSGGHD
jgi:hypothetical protein